MYLASREDFSQTDRKNGQNKLPKNMVLTKWPKLTFWFKKIWNLDFSQDKIFRQVSFCSFCTNLWYIVRDKDKIFNLEGFCQLTKFSTIIVTGQNCIFCLTITTFGLFLVSFILLIINLDSTLTDIWTIRPDDDWFI